MVKEIRVTQISIATALGSGYSLLPAERGEGGYPLPKRHAGKAVFVSIQQLVLEGDGNEY